MKMKEEGMNVAVLFMDELRVHNLGFSSGGGIFPYRFVDRVCSFPRMDEHEHIDTLFLSGVRKVKEVEYGFNTYIVFNFIGGTKVVCRKSKIKMWKCRNPKGKI